MIQKYNYISINEIVQRVKRHPLLQDISFEKVVQYTLDFFALVGLPRMFIEKQETVEISDFKGLLPCDVVQINQVKSTRTKRCLRAMTDNFRPRKDHERTENSFKTQGRIIFVSFPKGKVEVSYKAMPVDKDGYPMVLDNPVFLRALEAFIKKEEFNILFEMSQVPQVVMASVNQQYGWAVAELDSELTLPSVSEMESISRMWNTLIQRTTDFDDGFRRLGDREYRRVKP